MDIDYNQDAEIDAEIDRLRIALGRMEGKNKRKSAKGSFSVKKKLRVAPITKRMRSTVVTPRTAKKSDTRTSRSRQMQPRKLFGSETNSRSSSRPRSMNIDTPLQKSVQYTQSRKVRHKNARKVLNKMPAGGKSYARRRMTSRKNTYRGAVLPRQFRGETKHILINDACRSDVTGAIATGTLGGATVDSNAGYLKSSAGEKSQKIGDIHSWCLNPILQNNKITGRNGRQVDATYLRIQGHIRNNAVSGGTASTDNTNKAYVRMMILLVKGNRPNNGHATFSPSDLFKKIDGSVVGYVTPSTATGSGSAAVRTLQLEVNKGLYTKLYDQKFQLANKGESFGSSDRLFDAKIPLKQKIKFTDGDNADSFQTNQLVFVVYSVDPECKDAVPAVDEIKLEFESKFSYKDL
jgi:hypothetical protein